MGKILCEVWGMSSGNVLLPTPLSVITAALLLGLALGKPAVAHDIQDSPSRELQFGTGILPSTAGILPSTGVTCKCNTPNMQHYTKKGPRNCYTCEDGRHGCCEAHQFCISSRFDYGDWSNGCADKALQMPAHIMSGSMINLESGKECTRHLPSMFATKVSHNCGDDDICWCYGPHPEWPEKWPSRTHCSGRCVTKEQEWGPCGKGNFQYGDCPSSSFVCCKCDKFSGCENEGNGQCIRWELEGTRRRSCKPERRDKEWWVSMQHTGVCDTYGGYGPNDWAAWHKMGEFDIRGAQGLGGGRGECDAFPSP